MKRTKFQRFWIAQFWCKRFCFLIVFWIKTNEWVNELTNCHWRRFSTSSWVNELREHLNRNNILAVKQSSSEQRLNQSTWTEVEPLQRARPRNDLSQRRGISGYIWSADPDSGKFQPAVIQKKECAKSTQSVNPRGTENHFFQSRGWIAKVFYQQCSQNSTKTQFPRRTQKIRNEVR